VTPERYLLCDPVEKTVLEIDNGLAQLEYIEYLINVPKITEIRTSHIRELKRIAINGIYPCDDAYRDAFRQVRIEGSRHQLPHESLVSSLVDQMADKLNQDREIHTAVERAAY
jgi:Fic family protein